MSYLQYIDLWKCALYIIPGNIAGNIPNHIAGNIPGNLPGNITGNIPGNIPGNILGAAAPGAKICQLTMNVARL